MPKTPISYYGGKQNLLNTILPLIPEHRIYTEAFFGGGAVFFAKPPSEVEVINDNNNMVVNFYQVMQSDFELLQSKINQTLFSRATYNVAWCIYRMPHLFSKVQCAWAFYVATNMGFGCKIGSWGFDKYGKRLKSYRNKMMRFDRSLSRRLEGAQIENNDAVRVLKSYDTIDTFHYIDPPYIDTDQGHYKGYGAAQYRALLETLSTIKGKFLLSGFPNEILEAYAIKNQWEILSFEKPKTAVKASLGKPRLARKIEVLVANYPVGRGANLGKTES